MSGIENGNTEAAAIAELAQRPAQYLDIAPGRKHSIVPDGYTAQELLIPDEFARPAYIRQAVTLDERDSLVEYVNRFKDASTVLFANVGRDQIVAAIDYHNQSDGLAAGAADFVTHRATLQLRPSVEWATWTGKDGHMLPQADFARFLEENREDVSKPSGAELIELCRELHAHRKAHWGAVARTNGPYEKFEYQDETVAGSGRKGDVEIPTEFNVLIPVYMGGAPVPLTLFLRWTVENDAGLRLGFKIARREVVRQDAFKDIAALVGVKTDRTLVYGALA